jgi:acyl carrier protein
MTPALETIREIVRGRTFVRELDDDVTLGEEGLGLDSIAIAEVLLACEERFGVSMAVLLDGQSITIARIATHLRGELVA